MKKVSRRELAGVLAASATALAQGTPQGEETRDDLTIQREQLGRNSEALAKFQIAQTLEPAMVFKA